MTRLLEISYVKSSIGRLPQQKRTITALGLHRLNETVRHEDNPTIRGMVKTVEHLVTCREIESEQP